MKCLQAERERERLVEGYDKRRRLRQLSHRLPVKTSVDAYGLILTALPGQKKSVGQFLNIEYFKNFLKVSWVKSELAQLSEFPIVYGNIATAKSYDSYEC